MRNIIPMLLLATSTLGSCNHKTNTAQELQENLNKDQQEEFVANGGTAHGDTSETTSVDAFLQRHPYGQYEKDSSKWCGE